MTHRRPRFSADRSSAIVFEEPDPGGPDYAFMNLTHLDRRRTRISITKIAIVPTRHHFKHSPHIFYSARHWSDHSDHGKRPAGFWKVPRRRNASGSWLQSADAAEVRRHADRTATIAAHAASGKSRRDGRSLSAARSARGAGQIPGIVRASIKKIVGLPGHEQFGRVGDAEDHRSSRAQARNQRRIFSSDVSGTQTRTSFAAMSRNINRRLDGYRHTMQRPKFVFIPVQNRFLRVARLG